MREKSLRFAEPLSVEARCASTAAKTFARLIRANDFPDSFPIICFATREKIVSLKKPGKILQKT